MVVDLKKKTLFTAHPVVVVGAGHAGMQFATHLTEAMPGARIVLVDADADWPCHKPPLSKSYLSDRRETLRRLREPSWFVNHNVGFRRGVRVRTFNTRWQTVSFDNGEHLQYSRLILAMGSRPRVPEIPGLDQAGVVVLRNHRDAEQIRKWAYPATYAVVLGGGYIGVETATALARHGRKVTLIESGPRLLRTIAAESIAALVKRRLERAGVRVFLNTSLSEVCGDGRIRRIVLDSGESFPAEVLIVGTGAEPDTELAERARLDCDDGILVSPTMRTSALNVYAVGDCARFPSERYGISLRLTSIQNANDTARCAVDAIRGKPVPYKASPWFWTDAGGARVQICGVPVGANNSLSCGDPQRERFSVYHFSGDQLVAVESVDEPHTHLLARRFFDLDRLPTRDDVQQGPEHLEQLYQRWRRESLRRR
ncbi:FAD-dependent oxidoreductase [Granulosicoccaceae sp. 1_MG-2023]|nr:FAD-dependent oxidoreductase [Granulosicoccaceae sp. 1_MG-2023]